MGDSRDLVCIEGVMGSNPLSSAEKLQVSVQAGGIQRPPGRRQRRGLDHQVEVLDHEFGHCPMECVQRRDARHAFSMASATPARLPGITPVPDQNTGGPAHDGQSGRGNPRSRPAAAYASTASGYGHTMATGDTASDPF